MSGFEMPTGSKVSDLTGKTVMPGIVDAHAHMRSGTDGMMPQNNWSYLANLAFGVTCTHDPSHDTKLAFAASELSNTGTLLAPRIESRYERVGTDRGGATPRIPSRTAG